MHTHIQTQLHLSAKGTLEFQLNSWAPAALEVHVSKTSIVKQSQDTQCIYH